MLGAEFLGFFAPHDEQCCGQGIGHRTTAADDGGTEQSLGGPASAWIDDMTITLATEMKELLS